MKAWTVIEPGKVLKTGKQIEAVCHHLQAVSECKIRRLIISVPPGSTKSVTTAVMWPAWHWGPFGRPQDRFLFAAHADELSLRDSVRCRFLLNSEWYQARWPIQLAGDQNVKSFFSNTSQGFRYSTSVNAGVTGHRGDFLCLDDPHDAKKVESEAQRESVILWHGVAWSNRVNDADTSAMVIIGQRTHENDLIGQLIAQGGWEYLMLPEEFEPEVACVTRLQDGKEFFRDWRSEPGELLRPTRFAPKEIAEAKKPPPAGLGIRGYAAQHQQRPMPREGGMFKRHWFKIVDAVPVDLVGRVRWWDKASSDTSTADYTAGVLVARGEDDIYYVEDVIRGQWTPNERNKIMLQTAELDDVKGDVRIWTEQEPGSGGKESAEYSVRLMAGFPVRYQRSTGSKESRADPFAAQCEAGNVRIVRGNWNSDFLEELCSFPAGKHDDMVDAVCSAFNKVAKLRRLEDAIHT